MSKFKVGDRVYCPYRKYIFTITRNDQYCYLNCYEEDFYGVNVDYYETEVLLYLDYIIPIEIYKSPLGKALMEDSET